MLHESTTLLRLLRRCRHHLAPPQPKKLSRYLRAAAAATARNAIADYLHSVRSLPLHISQLIASNSPSSLASFLSSVYFPSGSSVDSLAPTFRRHLHFSPLPELDFFLESIGCVPNNDKRSDDCAIKDAFFLTASNSTLLSAAVSLHRAGFPWVRIGNLYSAGLLHLPADSLVEKVRTLAGQFHCRQSSCIVAACIAFPSVLIDADDTLDRGLLHDIAQLVLYLEGNYKECDVDDSISVFRKLRAFYDAGVAPGTMEQSISLLVETTESNVWGKLDFFERLGMRKEDVGAFVLQNPEVFDLDLSNLVISVPEYLAGVGLQHAELDTIREKYRHVVGRNRMINLPGVLQAVGLSEWFLAKITGGRHNLRCISSEFAVEYEPYDATIADEFSAAKIPSCLGRRLELLHELGFGENQYVASLVKRIRLTKERLRDRFNSLLNLGFEYPDLCTMIARKPDLLNHSEAALQKKVKYLTEELGYPLQYLCHSPVLFTCDVERLLKPRYNMLNWLHGHGLIKKLIAPASLRVYSEARFVAYLYAVHPVAPKQWFEVFSTRNPGEYLHVLRLSDVRRKGKDPGWRHGEKLPDRRWKCRYCGRVSVGGADRLKEHVAGIAGNVSGCQAVDVSIRSVAKEEYYRIKGTGRPGAVS